MNRGYSFTPRGQARSPPRRDSLQAHNMSRTSVSRQQAAPKQDINIDDFGDMGSDEDDFQAMGSHFIPPKPPAKPQYNLVPFGLLRDDDELVEDEDYDGVPLDDTNMPESPKKQPWQRSPPKPQLEQVRGDPISVLGSGNRPSSHLSRWTNEVRNENVVSRNRPGLGSSSSGSHISNIGDGDKLGARYSGSTKNVPSLMETDLSLGNPQRFSQPQVGATPLIHPGSSQTSSLTFAHGGSDSNRFLKTRRESSPSRNTMGFVRSTDDSNPFMKFGSSQSLSGNNTTFSSAKDASSTAMRLHDAMSRLSDKSRLAQSRAPVSRQDQDRGFPQSSKGQVLSGQMFERTDLARQNLKGPSQSEQILTPTSTAGTSSQLELLQAAALQQALAGLTQLGSQSGLGLLGAQNLLMQASQNPALAALLATGGLLNSGINSAQTNPPKTPPVQSAVPSAVPVIPQSNSGLLTYPLRSNVKGSTGSVPLKKSIPDGSGSSRYPEPDVGSLVFDPNTGYRFDASTGLHYDANSGYFFNSELKIFLRWDKLTQTYLKVHNPPPIPRFVDSSSDRVSYVKDSPLTTQNNVPSNFSNSNLRSSDTFLASNLTRQSNLVHDQSVGVPNPSFQKQSSSMLSTLPIDVSKPPPPLPNTAMSSSGFPLSKPIIPEQKPVILPNYAETSLFNKLRKAKLAQTAQSKSDRKWGTPDPLLDTAQKLPVDTDKPDVLNLKEILQRSRQFMQQNTTSFDEPTRKEPPRKQFMQQNTVTSFDGQTRKEPPRRQFMQQNAVTSFDGQKRKDHTRSQSGDRRKLRSRSRSTGRSLRRSQSTERPEIHRGKSRMSRRPDSQGRSPESKGRRRPSASPTRRRISSRSPTYRPRGKSGLSPPPKRKKSASRGRSPVSRPRGRASPSPEGRSRRPSSRGRTPVNRPRDRASPSPEGRSKRPPSRGQSPVNRPRRASPSPEGRSRRPSSRGRTPVNRPRDRDSRSPEGRSRRPSSRGRTPVSRTRDKASRSPEGRSRRPLSRGRSPPRKFRKSSKSPPGPTKGRPDSRGRSRGKSRTRRSISQEVRKKRLHSSTPDRKLQRPQSPKVKVVLDQSPGGSKIRGRSPQGKRLADRDLSPERGKVRRMLSPRKSHDRERNSDPPSRKPMRENIGIHGNRKSSEKDKVPSVMELKSIPCNTPQNSTKKPFDKDKNVSGYKSLSNLRNQGKDKPREKETVSEQTANRAVQSKNKSVPKQTSSKLDRDQSSTPVVEVDLTVLSSDDERHGRANHRLVSERTFAGGWEKKKPIPVSPKPSSIKKSDAEPASGQPSEDSTEVEDTKQLEESSEFDFLTDTLDDDKDSTVIDEYEEILDYQDLEEDVEAVHESVSNNDKPETAAGKTSSSKESIESSANKSCVDSLEPVSDAGTLEAQEDKDSTVVSTQPSLEDHSARRKLTRESDVPSEEVAKGSEVASECSVAPAIPTKTKDVGPQSGKDSNRLNKGDEAAPEMKAGPFDSDHKEKKSVEQSGPRLLESEEWNIVDSVDDREEAIEPNTSMGSCAEELTDAVPKADVEKSDSPQNAPSSSSKGEKVEVTEGGSNGKPPVEILEGDGTTNEPNSQSETEESAKQVRSVSDIEKFLLLSSQEVEAKREQGGEPSTSKNDKKSGIFSRLGDKLQTDEAGGEPKVVLELPPETPATTSPSEKLTGSAPSVAKPVKGKSSGAAPTKKKITKSEPKDSVASLFDDSKPTSQILIGPMNFIEPRANFQSFTQKYIKLMLHNEGVKIKNAFVCHEDVTGAPYHYILILFQTIKGATNYFNKCKGKFKCDEKLFNQVPGHLKHKLISGVESFVHYTENNWPCRVCKKGNFPPRSLCFGCFQHKDPEGFSPLSILEFVFPRRHSNFVGTPKLKFFVTKEKIIDSLPPLDGFDIKNIDMIMDEKMGYPAGICVFEMFDYIDAGKLKKFLNHRGIEAVSVDVYEKPDPVPSRSGSGDRSLPDVIAAENDVDVISADGGGGRDDREGRGRRESSPHFTVRVPDGRSPSPLREVRVARGRSPSPFREGRTPRGRSPSPLRQGRVPRGRSPSPLREGRVPRGRSPSPLREGRVPRGRSPNPLREGRAPGGRLSSPLRRRVSKDRARSRSPRHVSRDSRPGSRPPRNISRGRSLRGVSPDGEARRYRSQERSRSRPSGYRSPVLQRSPGRLTPSNYHSRSPGFDAPRRRSPSPRYRSPSPVRPIKPDGRGAWRYPPPDPTNFKFEPRSGLDYDPVTTLYYEPKSCCFYNDDTNEWLEYDPRSGRYLKVR